MTDGRLLGAGLIVLAATCFATLGPLTRFADDAGVGPMGFVTWRSALGAALMVAFLAARYAAGRRELVALQSIAPRSRTMLLVAALATTTLNLAIFIAFVRISIALSLLVFYLYPAFVAVASVTWFRERLDAPRWAALGLSLVGMGLVVAGPIGNVDVLGIGLAFLAAVSQAVYVLAARHGYTSVPSAQASTFFLAFAALAYVGVAVVSGNTEAVAAPLADSRSWPILLLAGSIGAAVPALAYLNGIRRIGAPRAAILSTLEPVVGSVLAALLLAEIPTPLQILGGALILVAAAILQLAPRGPAGVHEAAVAAEGRIRGRP